MRSPWNSIRLIFYLMAGTASHADDSMPIRSPGDGRKMRLLQVSLPGHIARRMAVNAPRAPDDGRYGGERA